jgi:hypothetical protein
MRPETKSGDRRNDIMSLVGKIPTWAIAARDNDEKRAKAASDPLGGQHLIVRLAPEPLSPHQPAHSLISTNARAASVGTYWWEMFLKGRLTI